LVVREQSSDDEKRGYGGTSGSIAPGSRVGSKMKTLN